MDQHQIRNLLTDESFINYCLDRDVGDKQFWESYIQENPEQRKDLEDLKQQIVSLGRYAQARNLSDRMAMMRHAIRTRRRRLIRPYRWVGAAAAVFIVAVVGVMLHRLNRSAADLGRPMITGDGEQYTSPTLVLSDGRAIDLDSLAQGASVDLGSFWLEKNGEGQLAYRSLATSDTTQRIVFHSLVVPRGNTYEVVLPDQSIAMLNAKTVLQFPSRFAGNQRAVNLSGEAFFQVKKDTAMPFVVNAGDVRVTVLGTTFNVSAYVDDGEVVTTLVGGKVSVKNDKAEVILAPGQQAKAGGLTADIPLREVDLDEVLAWKDRKLIFRDEAFPELIKRLGRWYDVEFVYRGSNRQRYNGVLSLDKPLEELMSILQETSPLTYRIEPTNNNLKERRVIIE